MGIEIGQIIGEYEVTGHLGAGGLGMVYQVRHLISQRAEAMKVLLPEQLGTPEMAERFRREVQLLATLNHINIASLHNAFYSDNQLFMVMELIHGETLRNRSMRLAIPLDKALGYVSQILSALTYAHQLGIVHRDIKPSNVMITEQDVVKLLDFGIAISDQASELTNPGFLLGSLNYMSPEQVSGGKATYRSDIYAVGVTVYELLTGKLPIAGTTNYEIMTGHLHHIPAPPIDVNPAIPLSVSNALLRALAKNPAERFSSAQEFTEAIRITPPTTESGRAHTVPLPLTSAIRPLTASGSGPRPVSSSNFASLPLEEVTKNLAVYIGPVAKFVVKKLALQCPDLDRLYAEAAKQIGSESDRLKFLRSRRS